MQELEGIYLNMALTQALTEIKEDINSKKENTIEQLQLSIQSARNIAKNQRLDRVAKLSEAIQIAKTIGFKKPNKDAQLKNQETILYLLGYQALEAEKIILMTRESDDPFIEKLRGLEEQLDLLENFTLNTDKLSVAQVDQAPSFGKKIKPKKSLILVVSAITGLMLGIFISLIRRAIKKSKPA